MKTLGTKLARLRTERGRTQQEIADLLEISQPAYHKWETDSTKPSLENLLKLCEVFQVELSELFEDALTLNITNKDCKIQNMGNPHSNFYNESPDLVKGIVKNQKNITSLLKTQNELIRELINKKEK
jgi:transcriptional regulator with XRE-family HTH domain